MKAIEITNKNIDNLKDIIVAYAKGMHTPFEKVINENIKLYCKKDENEKISLFLDFIEPDVISDTSIYKDDNCIIRDICYKNMEVLKVNLKRLQDIHKDKEISVDYDKLKITINCKQ